MTTKSRLTKEQEVKLVRECYDNFPEAGECLRCVGWDYKKFVFEFMDEEETPVKRHVVRLPDAIRGLRLFIAAVDAGKLRGLSLPAHYLTDTGTWDAFAFDALNQMAVFGEVIYG